MWNIYASDPAAPRIFALIDATAQTPVRSPTTAPAVCPGTANIGKVEYKRENELKAYAENGGQLELGARRFAEALLLQAARLQTWQYAFSISGTPQPSMTKGTARSILMR